MADKEACFHMYCASCAYYSLPEAADPCDECLAQPVSEDSHTPLYFKAKTKSASQK